MIDKIILFCLLMIIKTWTRYVFTTHLLELQAIRWKLYQLGTYKHEAST